MTGIAPKYYYLTLGLLAVCVVIGLYIALSFRREVNEDLGPTTERDLLDPLEKAFYSGLMDEAEFRRIQESVGKQKDGKSAGKRVISQPKPAPAQADSGIPPTGHDVGSPPPDDPAA